MMHHFGVKPRILIVDDNPNIHRDFELVFDAEILDQKLEANENRLFGEASAGLPNDGTYELDHALSGVEGVEKVQQSLAAGSNFQLAFVDIRMPGIDGVETIARIWKLDPAIQIVICTAFADYSQEELTARLGKTDKLLVLKKPFDNIEVTQLAGTLAAKWFLAHQAALKMEQMELLVARRTEKVLELQRREAQRIHELDQMKLQFLNNFFHEFRTPLTLLMGKVEQLVEAGNLKDQDRQGLHDNTSRLLYLVNHLAEAYTLGADETKLAISACDIVALLHGIVRIFQPVAARQQVDLQFHTVEDSHRAAFDASKLEKALFLVLAGTLQGMPAGGRITVAADFSDTMLNIMVEIVGGQLPEAVNSQPLLWLAFARNLVEIQNGKIILENPRDHQQLPLTKPFGYRFAITVPLIMMAEEAATGWPFSSANGEPDSSADELEPSDGAVIDKETCPMLLIIEADRELCQYIRQGFDAGYRIIEAADGQQGMKIAAETMPDLIIAEAGAAHMDGVAFCSKLKCDDLTSHIPVILLADGGDEQQQMKALEGGADEFIPKPFRLSLLKARVTNLLESRRRLRERFDPSATLAPREIATNQLDLQFMKRVVLVVEKNLSDFEFDVDSLAHEISVSRRQLFRKIKAITNQTPNMLIRSIRLNRAAQLLRESRLTISEITYAVGFSDLKHFREVFQERFGVLPSSYAEQPDK
jgi:DNA-binding response OmpR family regulator